MSRSALWKRVKEIGNYGALRWQSKTSQFEAFINNYEEQQRLILEQQQQLYNETHQELTKIFRQSDDKREDVASIIDNIKDKLNALPDGKIIRLTNGLEFVTGDMTNNRLASRIFQACDYDQEITGDYEIFDEEVDPSEDDQAYRIGDVNCLLNPILNIIQNKIDNSESKNTKRIYNSMLKNANLLSEQFHIHGATKELIQGLANATCSTIKVYDVITQEYFKFKQTKQTQSQFKFKFLNTRLNHVDIWDGTLPIVYLHPNPEIGRNNHTITRYVKTETLEQDAPPKYRVVSDEELLAQVSNYGNSFKNNHMYQLAEQLRENKQVFKFSLFNDRLVKIETGSETVICNEYADLMNREQAINKLFDPFAIQIRRSRYDPRFKEVVQCYEASLIKMAMNQCGRKALQKRIKDPSKLLHIDMVAGYTQYQNLPEEYNLGFPFLTDQRKVSSIQFAIQHNGLYLVRLRNLPPHVSAIFKENYNYSLCSAIIKYLHHQQVQIEIEGGIYGCSNDRLEGNQFVKLPADCHIPSYGKKPYYTAVSKWAIDDDIYKQELCIPDPQLASIIAGKSSHAIIKRHDDEYTQIIKKQVKDRYTTKAHLYAYILQYQQLNLMLQLEKMDMTRVHLICGDDIYYEPHQFEMLPIFRKKGKNNYSVIYDMTQQENNTFLINDNPSLLCEFGAEEPIYNQYQLHLGQGGSGKTYSRHQDIGSINQVYLTLTNALVRDQKASPFKPKCYTKDKFLANVQKHKLVPTNFIIDEIGLTGGGILNYLKNNFPMARVYMLGDKYQISSQFTPENNPFDELKYDLVLGEQNFKTDYRAINCPKLQKLKLKIRKWVDLGCSEKVQYFAVHKYANKITKQQWIDQYQTSQLITTCTNGQKDKWTSQITGEKYRVAKTFTHKGHTYCTGDILYELPDGYDYEKDHKNKTPKINKQHAFTCHSIQGMSQYDKLLMLCPAEHEIFKGYVYTAISRLTRIEDLYVLQFKDKQQETAV